jgi:integrase
MFHWLFRGKTFKADVNFPRGCIVACRQFELDERPPHTGQADKPTMSRFYGNLPEAYAYAGELLLIPLARGDEIPRIAVVAGAAHYLKAAWTACRKAAGVWCRRHDLRHTFISALGEVGVPESTMKAIAGWMSAKMLERYSHTRQQAKRDTVNNLPRRRPVWSHVPLRLLWGPPNFPHNRPNWPHKKGLP